MTVWRACIIRGGAAKSLMAIGTMLFSMCATASTSTDTQIAYFEALSIDQPAIASALGKSSANATSNSLRFDAFGRSFVIQLQPNPRFAAIAQKLQADPSRQVLQGHVQNEVDSWVRLTHVHSRWHGMMSSGGELYVIEPAQEVQTFAAPGLTLAKQGTVIFRLSDTFSALGQSFCGSELSADTETSTELDAYTKLVADLKSTQVASQAPGAIKRLEVSALGDTAFLQRFSSVAEAEDAVLARLNNVDGIFSSQLGIAVQVPSIDVYTQDPATLSSSTSANALLDSLGRLRSGSADLQARGVTHLFTGRDLDGSTVGIAYTKSLCNSRYSTSLTESRGRGTWTESLIAAHELGHNFGAVHDGSGVCASTPQTFLMAPQVNGSSTFSQCSLNSMQELAQAAPCLTAVPQPNISVATDLGSIQGYANVALPWSITVTNVGDAASSGVHVDIALPAAVQLVTAEVSGGSCATTNGALGCDLGVIAANSAVTINLAVKSSTTGAWPISAQVYAAADVDISNNGGSGSLAIDPSVDLTTNLTLVSSAVAQSSVAAQFTVSNVSDEDSPSLVANVQLPSGLSVTSMTLEGATCTVQSASVHCTRDSIGAHTTIKGSIELTATAIGTGTLQLSVSGAYHDPDTSNNTIARSLTVDAATSAAASKQASNGSSGGGGALDWLVLACGSLLAFARLCGSQRLLQPLRQRG